MACLKRYLPIYYPTAIFFFCGIELLWSAFCMAINQKFWQLSSSIFPIAYRIFNDTLSKGVHENFVWTNAEYYQLELYQYKLALMWFFSTLTILYSMLCIVPQFCTIEKVDGTEITFCVKKPMLGYIMAPILILLIIISAVILTWQWLTCTADYMLFQDLFTKAEKEERYLTDLERQMQCEGDDDKENSVNWKCDRMIIKSMLNENWLNFLFYTFIGCHLIMFLGFGLVNRDWNGTNKDGQNEQEAKKLETNGKTAEIQTLI